MPSKAVCKSLGPYSGAVELQKELAAMTQLELPATFVFDYPTTAEICGHIVSAMPLEKAPVSSTQTGISESNVEAEASALETMDEQRRKLYVESQVSFNLQRYSRVSADLLRFTES